MDTPLPARVSIDSPRAPAASGAMGSGGNGAGASGNAGTQSPTPGGGGIAGGGGCCGVSSVPGYFTKIGPGDVIFGRGTFANSNPGNVAFRRHVQSRQDDYNAPQSSRTDKARVAREVIDAVRSPPSPDGSTTPPGRFLRLLSPAEMRERGLALGQETWCEVDDGTVVEKVKQALRRRRERQQKKTQKGRECPTMVGRDAAPGGADAAAVTSNVSVGPADGGPDTREGREAREAGYDASRGGGPGASGSVGPTGDSDPVSCDPGETTSQNAISRGSGVAAVSGSAVAGPANSSPDPSEGLAEGQSSSREGRAGASSSVGPSAAFDSAVSNLVASCPGEAPVRVSLGSVEPDTVGALDSGDDLIGIAEELEFLIGEEEKEDGTSMSSELAIGGLLPIQEMAHDVGSEERSVPPMAGSGPLPGAVRSTEDEPSDANSILLECTRVALGLVTASREGRSGGSGGGVGLDDSQLSADPVGGELVALGSSIYQLFAGVDPFDKETASISDGVNEDDGALEGSPPIVEWDQQLRKRERRSTARKYTPLRDFGLPLSLCILVSSLLDATDSGAADHYETFEEVEEDLRLMIANPERYLFDADADDLLGMQLQFPKDQLYGREHHVSRLMDVFDPATGSGGSTSPEVVFISGYPGTGKSVLVDQLRRPLAEKNGHFISCKFGELGQVQPMSVIFAAFNDYCRDLLEGDVSILAQTREAINEALGSHGNVLTGLMPNLREVIGEEPTAGQFQVGGLEAQNRLLFHFRLFVRAIASPFYPVVLLLDDLQWADKAALDLIATLVSDRENTALLFIGCYRDNESHPLLQATTAKLILAGISITNIKLESIDRESVNALVSDTLRLSPRLTMSLATTVHAKTNGNPLFVVQFLKSLCDEGMLQYSASSRRWEWDVKAIQSKDVFDNVVGLMTSKMLKLEPGLQWLLKVAACLGSRSEETTLQFLCADGACDEIRTSFLLNAAVNEGLMYRMDTSYIFSHDQIQQAAYSLIPLSEREALHLQIGRALWRKAAENDVNNRAFIIIDQLHRGSNLISDHGEKVKVAQLCLKAGEKAISSYAFMQASICLLQGSTLLEESDWQFHYNLILRLFTACSEAQFATGNSEGAIVAVNVIMKHGRCLQDKLQAFYTLLESMVSIGKQLDAIVSGLDMLAQLGEVFPSEPNQVDVLEEFSKTRAMLKGASADSFLAKDELQDPSKIAVLELCNSLILFSYNVNQQLMSLLIFRSVQISTCHGVCRESLLVFASFGMVLSAHGQFEEGYRYGKLSLSLLDRFNAKERQAKLSVCVYCTSIFIEPAQASLLLLKHGYEAGMSMGDINFAHADACFYSVCSLLWGAKLDALAAEAGTFSRQMKEYNNHFVRLTTDLIHQATLNLMGCPEDPTELTGEIMDQEKTIHFALEKGLMNVVNMVYLLRMWLAYLFGRYDLAAEMVEQRRKMSKLRPVRLEAVVKETFYTGLVALVMERGNEGGEWRNTACKALEQMKSWAKHSAWNIQHKVHLLEAEIAYYLNGDSDAAGKSYEDAIRLAGEHRFVHEQALACERAGIFYSETVNQETGSIYFQRAHACYLEWGATRKAKELLSRIGD